MDVAQIPSVLHRGRGAYTARPHLESMDTCIPIKSLRSPTWAAPAPLPLPWSSFLIYLTEGHSQRSHRLGMSLQGCRTAMRCSKGLSHPTGSCGGAWPCGMSHMGEGTVLYAGASTSRWIPAAPREGATLQEEVLFRQEQPQGRGAQVGTVSHQHPPCWGTSTKQEVSGQYFRVGNSPQRMKCPTPFLLQVSLEALLLQLMLLSWVFQGGSHACPSATSHLLGLDFTVPGRGLLFPSQKDRDQGSLQHPLSSFQGLSSSLKVGS